MPEASQPLAYTVVERSDTTGGHTTKQGIPEGCKIVTQLISFFYIMQIKTDRA